MFANRFYLFIVLILIFTTIIISTPINKYDRSSKSIESLNDNNNNNLDVKQNDDDDDDDDDNQNDIKENLIKINRQRFRTQQRHKDLEPLTD